MKVTLKVTYGTIADHAVQVMPKEPGSPVVDSLPQPHPRDMKEEQLSADILAMQRRICGDKRQEYDAQSKGKKLKDRVSASVADPREEKPRRETGNPQRRMKERRRT